MARCRERSNEAKGKCNSEEGRSLALKRSLGVDLLGLLELKGNWEGGGSLDLGCLLVLKGNLSGGSILLSLSSLLLLDVRGLKRNLGGGSLDVRGMKGNLSGGSLDVRRLKGNLDGRLLDLLKLKGGLSSKGGLLEEEGAALGGELLLLLLLLLLFQLENVSLRRGRRLTQWAHDV